MDIGIAYTNGQLLQASVAIFSIVIAFSVFVMIFEKRKTQKYRKYIADMYIAAKIRFFAEEDNLDLVAEEKTFKSWNKKQSGVDRDVDSTVAAELKEKIEGSSEGEKKGKK